MICPLSFTNGAVAGADERGGIRLLDHRRPGDLGAGRKRGPPQDARLERPRRIVEHHRPALLGRRHRPASTGADSQRPMTSSMRGTVTTRRRLTISIDWSGAAWP